MFNDTHPPTSDRNASEVVYAPALYHIRRVGPALVGERSQRLERDERLCTPVVRASIRDCKSNTFELSWEPYAHIDWRTCRTTRREQRMRVRLWRDRAFDTPAL